MEGLIDIHEEVKYPHVLLEGILVDDELLVLQSHDFNKNHAIPLYISIDNSKESFGFFEFSVDFLVKLLVLSSKYNLTLFQDADTQISINLYDTDSFMSLMLT